MQESCLVWGPNHGLDTIVCLECLATTDGDTWCPQCGYPLCLDHLDQHPTHDIECQYFTKIGHTLGSRQVEQVVMQYPIIEIIR